MIVVSTLALLIAVAGFVNRGQGHAKDSPVPTTAFAPPAATANASERPLDSDFRKAMENDARRAGQTASASTK